MKKHLYVTTFPFRKNSFSSKKIVACIFSVGERTEEQAILSVKKQKLQVSGIEVIRNVSPISAASQRVFDLATDADYVLWVDADMILYDYCTEYLIRLARSNVLFSAGKLIDPVFGPVGWIKLLNMSLARQLDIKFRNVLRCDVDFCKQAKEKNDNVIPMYGTNRILGTHHASYTAKELFRKTQIWKKKMGNRIDKTQLRSMINKYCQTDNKVLLAGILGLILPNTDDSIGESSPQSGLENWDKVSSLLGSELKQYIFQSPTNLK